MFGKKCPICGAKSFMNDGHFGHKFHKAHQIQEFIHRNHFFKNNPIGGTIGMIGLGVVALIELAEDHQYYCEAGHSFKA